MEDDYKAYRRRFFIILAYSFSNGMHLFSFTRKSSVISAYAKFYNTTNEVSAPPVWGIDMLTIVFEVASILSFIPWSVIIDKFGIQFIIMGSFGCALANWIWYVGGKMLVTALVANVLLGISGALVSVSLLAISNRWFPPGERAKATAVGALLSNLGGLLGIMIPPFFKTRHDEIVDLTLESCNRSKLTPNILAAYGTMQEYKDVMRCTGDFIAAKDAFCCYLPVDIFKLNLTIASLSTLAFICSALSVRNLPPTPPAPSGEFREYKGVIPSLKSILSKRNTLLLTLSELIMIGPPFLVLNTLSRIFPGIVSQFSVYAILIGMVLSIPMALLTAHLVDKTKAYFTAALITFLGSAGFWFAMSMSRITTQPLDSYVFVVNGILAIGSYLVFESPVYELKLEYSFDPHLSNEGGVISLDKIATSVANLIFVPLFAPERVGSSSNTIYICTAFVIMGCIMLGFIKEPYRYYRLSHDRHAESCFEEGTQERSRLREFSEMDFVLK